MTASSESGLLIRRAMDGDEAAIGELFARYRAQLRRMVAIRLDPRLKVRFDPSDIVQSVLAEAARKMSVALDGQPDRFYPWLRQLAWDRLARLYRDHVRLQKRSVRREVRNWQDQIADQSMCDLAHQMAARQLGPHSRLVREELQTRVRRALEMLPACDREVLVLRFLERLDIVDTAAALGVTESAVKSRQFRAMERLGRLLRDGATGAQP